VRVAVVDLQGQPELLGERDERLPTETTSAGSTSCLIDSSREGMTPSVLYPMSSRTSSRSTLTTVPSTMSPSLKYLMVSSIAARNASSDPMSSTATLLTLEVASMLLVMWADAPVDW